MGTIDESMPNEPRAWINYVNAIQYAKSARAMKAEDLEIWYNKYIDRDLIGWSSITSFPLNAENKLISTMENGYYYWLPTTSSDFGVPAMFSDIRHITDYGDRACGVRILVSLTSEVKFGETPGKVEHDGFSYNKWIIK